MRIVYTDRFYKHFCYWKANNEKIVEKIRSLIVSIQEDPFKGIGKPEPLGYALSGCWSRRINREHRLVYKVEQDVVTLLTCKFHYDICRD